jgi:hypothetical protein
MEVEVFFDLDLAALVHQGGTRSFALNPAGGACTDEKVRAHSRRSLPDLGYPGKEAIATTT